MIVMGFTLARRVRALRYGTLVTESWEMLPAGLKRFDERFGPDAAAQVANRFEAARTGIPQTLAALKRIAEGTS
jgi:hypothetical protein